jgi:hypothetical protein
MDQLPAEKHLAKRARLESPDQLNIAAISCMIQKFDKKDLRNLLAK